MRKSGVFEGEGPKRPCSEANVHDDNALNIYVDGSSFQNPRRGGVGVLFITIGEDGEEKIECLKEPGYKEATNNQMEIQACIVALKHARKYYDLKKFTKIVIHTDSLYVKDGQSAAQGAWPLNDWNDQFGKPILNVDLWKKLLKAKHDVGKRVDFEWVKGHSKNKYNKMADKLAKESANNPLNQPLIIVFARKKTTTKSVKQGSIRLSGQVFDIRIVTLHYMKRKKTNFIKYEVLSRTDVHFGLIDTAFTRQDVRAAHCYKVRMGADMKVPSIEEIIEELNCKTCEKIERES